jgi:hypothetical protein
VVTAYSPLGSSDSYTGKMEGAPSLLKSELVNDIAKAVERSPAQVLIRWAVQKGVVVRVTPFFPPRTRLARPLTHVLTPTTQRTTGDPKERERGAHQGQSGRVRL